MTKKRKAHAEKPRTPKRHTAAPRKKVYLAMLAPLVLALAGYLGYQGLVKPHGELPLVGDFDQFRNDPSGARALCQRLGLPDLPDITRIDEPGQRVFHEALVQLRSAPDAAKAVGQLGRVYQAQRFFEQAASVYRRAVELAPDDYTWHYTLGVLLAERGDMEGAQSALERARTLNPDYPPVWMQLAWRALDRAELDVAMACLNRYVAMRPEDPFGYVERASLHSRLGQWDPAKSDLDRALQLGPVGKHGHRLLGLCYRQLGQSDESRFHLRMSREDQPGGQMADPRAEAVAACRTYRDPLVLDWRALMDRQQYRQAISIGLKLIERYRDTPDYGPFCLGIAHAYQSLHDFERARQYALEATRARPEMPQPYATLALALAGSSRPQEALSQANKALELAPNESLAHYARGVARLELATQARQSAPTANREEAQSLLLLAADDFRHAVEAKPLAVDYLKALVHAQLAAGLFDEAIAPLRTLIRLNPDDPPSLGKLAWILATRPGPLLPQDHEAITLARRAAELTGESDPRVLDTLAAAYAASGQFEEAVAMAQRAAELADAADEGLAGQIRHRLALYEQRRPFRTPTRGQAPTQPGP